MHTTPIRTAIGLFIWLLAATTELVVAQSSLSSRPPGIDTAGMDRSVKPGDDFFAFANGTWDRTWPSRRTVPEDRWDEAAG